MLSSGKDGVPIRKFQLLTMAILVVLFVVTLFIVKVQTKENIQIAKSINLMDSVDIAEIDINKIDINKPVKVVVEKQGVTSRSTLVSRKNIEVEPSEPEVKIEDVTISVDMDLTVRTGLTKEQFKELISRCRYDSSGFFLENSDLIYDVCEEYGINEIFFCGLISAESGWNIASNHRAKCNYISLMSKGSLIRYSSVEEGLRAAARCLHNNYLSEDGCFYYGKTLSAVKTKFCPSSSTWVNLVYGRMKQLLP